MYLWSTNREFIGPTLICNVVQFAPGYVCVSECESNSVKVTQSYSTRSDDRSGGAMGDEDIETAKSEFRLGMSIYFAQHLYTHK